MTPNQDGSGNQSRAQTHDDGMTAAARRVYAAHVTFELQQWQGSARQQRLAQEVDAFCAWAQSTPLCAVLDASRARTLAGHVLLDATPNEALSRVLGQIAARLARLECNQRTHMRDVVDAALLDEAVELFIAMPQLRQRLLHQALHNPLFITIATELLYQGIKDYVFADNGILQGIPAVGSLLRGSASAFNRRVPGLEAQVEKRVRAFLEANMGKTLARSEALLLDVLDAPRIRQIAAQAWAQVRDMPLSAVDVLTDTDVEAMAALGLRFWGELRQTDYVAQLLDAGVQEFYRHYGDLPMTAVLEQWGFDSSRLAQGVADLADPLLDAGLESCQLQAFIERRLAPFYRSPALLHALADPA